MTSFTLTRTKDPDELAFYQLQSICAFTTTLKKDFISIFNLEEPMPDLRLNFILPSIFAGEGLIYLA